MVFESILSTMNPEGDTHFAPIGIILPDSPESPEKIRQLKFKLFAGSCTYENLRALGEGVVNLTDNLLYFTSQSLRGRCKSIQSEKVRPHRLADACRVWEFSVKSFGAAHDPVTVIGEVLRYEELGGFSGLCRAHGAVLEAAVAVSRSHFLPKQVIESKWATWQEIVNKTGGQQEKAAFEMLTEDLVEKGFELEENIDTFRGRS